MVVVRRWPVAQGIVGLELSLHDGGELPAHEAGAHIDLHLPGGLQRQYSLCGDPRERSRWRIAVLRDPASRGGSAAVHDHLHEGVRLKVGGPRNLFRLAEAPAHLLLGGGIGITPLLAMAQSLHLQGQRFRLHACFRSPALTAFAEEMGACAYAKQMSVHHDDGPLEQRFDVDAVLATADAGCHLYVCGPAGFMAHVLAAARRAGWSEERLHQEHFAAAPMSQAGSGAFELRLARSGRCLPVPADRSALDVLLDAGVEVAFSCEAGVCGSCVLPVLEGQPDHRDSFLTAPERAAGRCFTPCCSRALTSVLVVDL